MTQKTKRSMPKKHTAHVRRLHAIRLSIFGVLIVGLLGIQLVAAAQANATERSQVLAYAAAISPSELLTLTNNVRAANGLRAFSQNSKLNNGAQAKANDMIAKNYWSHVAPDGTQPWNFFTNAGYQYSKAGENLAYGFDTSGQVISGWMNSAGHRANILGTFVDVGFGIASGPNFQGGENTVIVAFYATAPVPVAPAPATASTAPKPQEATAPKPAAPAPATTPTPQLQSAPVDPVAAPTPQPSSPVATNTDPPAAASTPPPQEPKKISNLETTLNGKASWAIYASLGLVGATSLGFAGTHVQLVRRSWKYSKHFVLLHPALDTAVLAAIAAVILTSASGFIR